ncbi:MAG: ShlB/FhaC/HecB family hemolysin secretion/activation protein, partial [Betaproteobacteria bacterium]
RQNEPDVRLPAPTAALELESLLLPEESPCFRMEHLRLEGNPPSVFSWLEKSLAVYEGRCIGHQGINLILQRASAQIISKGYVTTRLGVPEQDLASGTLRLVLVPGVVRVIRIVGDAPDRSWRSAFPVRPGELLNLRDIEQGLEQMKRVPSQEVTIDIAPGETPGESDIVLTVTQSKPWRVALTLDDSGAKATGRLQTSLTASLDNPLGLNDLFSFSVNNDAERTPQQRGTAGQNYMYSVPWGNWTLLLSDSISRYLQTVKGINQTFQSSGDAHNQEIKLQRLVCRDQAAKTTLQFRLLARESRSFIEDAEIVIQHRRTTSAELGVAHRKYFGSSQLDLLLAHRQGVPWIGGQVDRPGRSGESPTFGFRAQTLDATLITPFSIADQSLRWISALRVQSTTDVLYGTDFIAIGGRYSVRGFDGDTTLAAEHGGYLRNDLELPIASIGHAAYIGIDHGWVGGPSAEYLVGRKLTGAVVGLRGGSKDIYYDLFIGGALQKPEGFPVSRPVAGFLLSYQL